MLLAMGVGLVTALGAIAFAPSALQAQGRVLADYVTRISDNDKVSSQGIRHTDVGAILGQDRANMHRFDSADPEDESDGYFTDQETRALFGRLVSRGLVRPDVRRAIINGNPLVRVTAHPTRVYVELIEP